MTTALQQLLGDLPKAQFVAETLFRQPLSRAGLASEFCQRGSRESLAKILRQSDVDAMIVRRGEQYTGAIDNIESLLDDGYTILIRHAERHCESLYQIANDFARDFAAPVNIHMYATPADQWGFPWHYDAEEVFIVQTTGRKEYSLRKNTVNPWPLEETLPADMRYEREIMPMMRVELAAGDWLYVPGGWWHKGESRGDEVALSLAIGVMPRTAIDVFDHLRAKLLDSLIWRQRLPIVGEAQGEADAASPLREVLTMLGEDLRREIDRIALAEELCTQFRTAARA